MQIKQAQHHPLWTSVIVHLVVLIVLSIATLVRTFLPKDSSHVFELISDASQSNAVPAAHSLQPLPNFTMPDLQPLNVAESEDIGSASVAPSPSQPVQAEAMRMSYEEFIQKNPLKPPRRKPQPALPTPVIDTSKYSRHLQHNLPHVVRESAADLTAAERSALQRYGDQLNRRLNQAWVKPVNLSGIELVVSVVFEVSPSGQIKSVRLNPASGNPAFDASVKAAFAKVASGGVTPTGQAHRFTMSFRMVD